MNCPICTKALRNGEVATRFSISNPGETETEHVAHARCLTLWQERNKGGKKNGGKLS